MKALQYVESSKVLAIDIETVRVKEKYEDLSEGYKSAWEYKNKQHGVVPDYEILCDLWEKKASQFPEFSKICAVSIAYLGKGVLKCKNYVSVSEKMILKELATDINRFSDVGKYTLVGHASGFFDYPFMCKRFLINGLPIPNLLDESGSKPWEKSLLCTNELWKSFGSFGNAGSSLQALCNVFGIEVSKVDLVGDGVGKAYFNGELVRIADYCNLDAIATYNLFRKLKLESTFKFADVEYVNQGHVIEPVPFMTELNETKTLTDGHKKAILEFCEGLSPSEVDNVKLILESTLSDDKTGKLSRENELFIADL